MSESHQEKSALEAGAHAVGTVQSAVKVGKAIAGAAKGAAAGPYGMAVAALLSNKTVRKGLTAAVCLLMIPILFIMMLPLMVFGLEPDSLTAPHDSPNEPIMNDDMYLRKDLYTREAASLLRIVTTYRIVLESQIYRFFPGKEVVVKNLLHYLEKQGRICYCAETMRYAATKEDLRQPDKGLLLALWVLIDFIDKVEYHSSSDFPVKIIFFANSEMFAVIHIPYDSEMLVSQALAQQGDGDLKRIVIVDAAQQIPAIQIPSVAGYCTVDADGLVQYYKFH